MMRKIKVFTDDHVRVVLSQRSPLDGEGVGEHPAHDPFLRPLVDSDAENPSQRGDEACRSPQLQHAAATSASQQSDNGHSEAEGDEHHCSDAVTKAPCELVRQRAVLKELHRLEDEHEVLVHAAPEASRSRPAVWHRRVEAVHQ